MSSLLLALALASSPGVHGRTTHPVKPSRKERAASRVRYPAVQLVGAHVGETLSYRPYDDRGRPRRDAARALERLMRCRHTGARHRLHPRLGDALYKIARRFAGHRIEIYSGYRPRAYCNRAHSRHMTGSAVDFHVAGVRNEQVIAYLKSTFHPAGVGFYPHGVHVHLDLERRVDTYWIDPGPPTVDPVIAQPAARDTAPLPALVADEDEIAEPVALPAAPAVALPTLGDPPRIDPGVEPELEPEAAPASETPPEATADEPN
jgi:uncharacterized protein YcbK (DUF882 family)